MSIPRNTDAPFAGNGSFKLKKFDSGPSCKMLTHVSQFSILKDINL